MDKFGLDALFKLAAQKDPGFSIEVFAEMLGRFDRLRPAEFGIEGAAYETLSNTVGDWRERCWS